MLCRCNTISNKISFICKKDYMCFLDKQNVQAVGLGYKESNGIITCEKCIKVFVTEKIPNSELSIEELVPPIYRGVKTDVVENGTFTTCGLTDKVRPAPGGYSVGPAGFKIAGTLGCLARNPSERALYVLSTNHILARLGKVHIGTPILQPGVMDGGKVDTDTIGHLTRFVPIKLKTWFKTPENYIDAAVAKVTNPSLVSPQIALVNKRLKSIGIPRVGDSVFKVGRTTELTKGIITAIDVTAKVRLEHGDDALFKNQTITTAKTDVGDSGSILTTSDMHPVGMLLGNSSKGYSIGCDLTLVTSQLQVQLVTENDDIYGRFRR